jgi:multiple sugar transport system ATP-binding protein
MNLVPAPLVGAGGSNLIAGFRPEHMRVNGASGSEISFGAKVEVIEYLGNEKLVHVSREETPLTALVPVEQPVSEGEDITFEVRRDKLHLFDAETEQAVR